MLNDKETNLTCSNDKPVQIHACLYEKKMARGKINPR